MEKIVDFIFVFEIVKFIINLGFTKSINVFTVDSLLTHILRWMPRAMGFEGVWGLRIVLKIDTKIFQKNYHCTKVVLCSTVRKYGLIGLVITTLYGKEISQA